MKNNAILKAGKIRPTRGTKIEGKRLAVIILFLIKFEKLLIVLIINY